MAGGRANVCPSGPTTVCPPISHPHSNRVVPVISYAASADGTGGGAATRWTTSTWTGRVLSTPTCGCTSQDAPALCATATATSGHHPKSMRSSSTRDRPPTSVSVRRGHAQAVARNGTMHRCEYGLHDARKLRIHRGDVRTHAVGNHTQHRDRPCATRSRVHTLEWQRQVGRDGRPAQVRYQRARRSPAAAS